MIEIGITNLDLLTQVENEKFKKYDIVANELSLIYKCKVKILPYVMTWEGLVTKYHKKYSKEIGIQLNTQAYIQSLVLRKTLESLSFDRRRGLEDIGYIEEPEELCKKLVDDMDNNLPDAALIQN